MAKGKIGAIIALDGEKEFKQAVTDCNKSLSTLKSEMSLVKAESEGQANSLDALQKKHDVLTRVLEEQQQKQEAISAGLKHARESYDKVGTGLEDLRGKLSDATEALESMKKSSDTSEDELKKQEKAVKELADAVAKGEKNYQSAGNRIKDWEAKLNTAKAQVIKANAEVNKNAAYMKEAEEATDHCASSIDEFGKAAQKATEVTRNYSEVIKDNLVNTATEAMKGMVTDALSSVTELEDAAKQMQASTGASAQDMKAYQSTLESIYGNNYGDSLGSVADAMGMIKQYSKETDPSRLQQMTESAITLDDVFGMDLKESIRGVDALMTNMGLSADDAFDYIAKGAQNGLDKSGELVDNIAEYSQLWGQAGFSAQEMFTILQNGLDSGAYNLDKVNDFVKEFGNSLADGRIEDNIGAFSEKTGNLFYAWKQGKATTKDVFNSVIDNLGTMTNKQDALTLASTVWSALGEDNAMSVITSLNKVNNTYDDVKGTMESIKDIKYDSLSNKWEELSRKFKMEIAGPVAEEFLPMAEDGLEMLINNMDLMVPAIAGIGTALAGLKLASIFGVALNPVTLVGGALVAGATALVTYADNAGEASQKIQELVTANDKVVESSNNVVSSTAETISAYDSTMADIEAKGEYAQTLADRIETLASNTGRSNAETSVMKQYISQLNEMVPGLNLAYDEQTKSLTKTNEQIEDYIENSQKQLEVQAAEKYRTDLIQRRMDLEIEEIKLQNELNDLNKQKNGLNYSDNEKFMLSTMNDVEALISGNADKKKSWDEVTEAIEDNQEAAEENKKKQEEVKQEGEAVKQVLEELEQEIGNTTQVTEENTRATQENSREKEAQAAADARAAQEEQARAQAQKEATAQIVENVQSQISIFDEFSHNADLTSEKVLENMTSQAEAMKNWADNLEACMDRGKDGTETAIDEGILKKLAEMGPQGADYVAAFAAMTDSQIKEANKQWKRTMEETEIGATLAAQQTKEIDKLTAELLEKSKGMGEAITTGTSDGVKDTAKQVTDATGKMAEDSIDSAKVALDSQSPSRKMHVVGADASIGFANGILSRIIDVVTNSRTVASSAIIATRQLMNPVTFYGFGRNVSSGLAEGILAGRSEVVNAVAAMCESATEQARKSLDINSPSKVFEELGGYSAQGYGIGFQEQMKYVQTAVNDSMRFSATAGQGAEQSSLSSRDMTDLVENALYNGMMNAMSRVKIENNLGNLQVRVTFGTDNLVEVLEGADREFRSRNGYGMFERG